MIKPELYKRTTDILYQAYFKDFLEHHNCFACAVGNLVAANCGYELQPSEEDCGIIKFIWPGHENPMYRGWATVFYTEGNDQHFWPHLYNDPVAKNQINATGYTLEELMKIEFAFETASRGDNSEDFMYNGLEAVLNVLQEIHQVTDEDLLQANNKRFKDHYATRTEKVSGL